MRANNHAREDPREGCQSLVQAGPGATGAGQALAEVDPVCGGAQTGEDLALGGEVLQDG